MTVGHFLDQKFNAKVSDHLTKVYGLVGLCASTTGLTAWAGLTFPNLGLLNPSNNMCLGLFIAFIGLFICVRATRNTKEMMAVRLAFLLGFAATAGAIMVPLLQAAAKVDPGLLVLSLAVTAILFTSLSMCALMTERRAFLFLGGPLVAFAWVSLMLALVACLADTAHTLDFYVNVYLGLLAMCGFVLYDTQTIVEELEKGKDDFILHAVDLFLHLLNMFIRVLRILLRIRKGSNSARSA